MYAHRLGLAEVVIYIAIAALALSVRLPALGEPDDNYDEGSYLASLFLMRSGYRPFVDIHTGEGPLNLHLAYISYALGGYTLTAARTGSVLISLVGLLGVAWAARAVGGRIAGATAAFALALSPTFLRVSRWVGPEAGAIALSAAAVGAAAWAYRTDRDRWRALSGALLALANLIQASVPMAAVPIALLTFKRGRRQAAMVTAAAGGFVVIAVLLLVGPVEVLNRIVAWRVGGQQLDASPVVLLHNADMLIDKTFRQEQPAFYALAAAGWLALIGRRTFVGLALGAWLIFQLLLLLLYTELSSHLGATLIAPLAVLVGLGVGAAVSIIPLSSGSLTRKSAASVLAACAAIWYVSAVPALFQRDQRLIAGELSSDRDLGRADRNAVRSIRQLTEANDFVLTDQPYLAFLASRKVPPELVDPSTSRINAGALTARDATASLRKYQPRLVVLWTGKLERLDTFARAVAGEYDMVEDFGGGDEGRKRVIYRRRDARPS